ncbi:unnamed protein product [Discula destructiva]
MEDASSPPRGRRWDCLPYELHRKTLQILAHDELKSQLLAEYAVVCKSWQVLIEEVNFKELAIKHADVSKLDEIVQGPRRAYLKHLWLSVELDKYHYRLRFEPESEEEQEANNFKFTLALYDLFEVLETWDTPGFWKERNGRGLNLELKAFSPSDKKNLFGSAGLNFDGNSRYFDSLLDFYLLALNEPRGIHGLPMVKVITGLHILRRNYRNISAAAVTPIIRSLPCLEEVRLEPWQQPDEPAQEDVDSELASQIPFWPSQLRRVSLFTHFGAFDPNPLDALLDADGDTIPRPNTYRFLGQGLQRLSTTLEELSVSYMTDAEHFFEPFTKLSPRSKLSPAIHWPNLQWLTLTSGVISKYAESDEINGLLRGAGMAAQHMPKLQAMELYNATKWHGAGVFRYLVINNTGVVSWTSVFKFKMSREVKTTWRQVARQHTRQEPFVFDEVELQDYSGGPEGFIHAHLATRELVLHAASSKDMMDGRSYPQPVLRLRNTTVEVQPAARS